MIEGRLISVLRQVESSDEISQENKSSIQKFYSSCVADGLTIARVAKLLNHIRLIAILLRTNFGDATKDDIVRVVREIESNPAWSAATKHDYKVVLKKFYKCLHGTGEFPEEVKWVKRMMSEDDVRRLVEAAQHLRDKAFILLLYESGCRIGEILGLRIRNVLFDANGAVLPVRGKTGQRRVRVIASASLLSVWLNNHPLTETPDSPLWIVVGRIVVGTKNHDEPLTYASAAAQLKKIARRAGISKRVNPHSLRHARATLLANNLTEAQMKEYFGWVQSSGMAAVYVHLSGRDVDNAILKLNGLAVVEKKGNEEFKIKNCVRCQERNSPVSKFCNRCGSPLDVQTAIELDEKRKTGDEVISMLVSDPQVQGIIVSKI